MCVFTFAWWRSTPYMESFFTFSRKCISASAGVIPLNIQSHVGLSFFFLQLQTFEHFSFDLQNLYVLCSSMIFSSISFVWFGAKQSSLTSSEPHSSERQTDRSHDCNHNAMKAVTVRLWCMKTVEHQIYRITEQGQRTSNQVLVLEAWQYCTVWDGISAGEVVPGS